MPPDLLDLSEQLPPGFERAPALAPRYVPSPTFEDFILAVTQGPTSEMRLLIVIGSRGEGKTSSALYAAVALSQRLEREGKPGLLPLRVAVIRDTWTNLRRALRLDALVLTPSGWVKAGDVSVGDRLISANGLETEVLGVYPQGDQPLWTVRFSDGTAAEVTGEHLWAVQGRWDREQPGHRNRRCPRSGWRPAPGGLRIATTDQLRARLEHTKPRHTWSIPLVQPVQFPSRPVPIDPYLLGVLLGDGGLSQRGIRFTTADPEILGRVKAVLPSGVAAIHVAGYDYRIVGQRGKPNPVLEAVRRLGLWGCRSAEKFIPDDYLWNDVETRLNLLRGLMDTDGCASLDRHVSFYSTSEQLAEGVEFLVRSLGGLTRRKSREFSSSEGHAYRGHWVGHRSPLVVLAVQLPPHLIPFALSRKAERLADRSRRPYRWVVGVEPGGYGPTVCFRVAHPSGLFVMHDFIVTHNTTLVSFEENRQKGLPIEFLEGRTEAVLGWTRPAVHFYFFGLDNRADADKLQGFTCGLLWLEEVAPAADLATGIPFESLGVGASSVRQAGVPPRILITLNPPDPDHWVLKVEKHLDELGLPELKVKRFLVPPGEKARHFHQLAAEATDPVEQEAWDTAAREFEAYRTRSGAILEQFRPDLAARLFGGEIQGIAIGERIVPEFVRDLHVAKDPVPILPGVKIYRAWDAGLTPSCCWFQVVPPNIGINVLGSRTAINVGMTQLILQEVLPFQEKYGLLTPRKIQTNFGTGARGGFEFEDIGDPALGKRDESDSERSARKTVEAMLNTTFTPGPTAWPARRDALHTGFIRKRPGARGTMFIQIDPDENELLIQSLESRAIYPVNPATGHINDSIEAAKKHSGIFFQALDAFAYGLAKLFPAEEWLKVASAPPPRTPVSRVPWYLR